MVWSWFKPRSGAKNKAEPRLCQIDRLTYAIGDIHGYNDLFVKMLDTIRHDAAALGEKPRIVLLGDYIDRGPYSADVLNTIIDLKTQTWCDVEVLMGNHEIVLLRFALDSDYGPAWLKFGGAATLAAYGLPLPQDRNNPAEWRELRREFVKVIPPEHLKLLSEAKIYFIAGDYLFVHGGVRPGVPLDEQDADTFLWIREEFLSSEKSCDYVVVHGHSARVEVDNFPWRIGVDTGAYATGILTCVRLMGTERLIIQVTRQSEPA